MFYGSAETEQGGNEMTLTETVIVKLKVIVAPMVSGLGIVRMYDR